MATQIAVILFAAAGFLAIVISLAAKLKHAARIAGAATVIAALGGFFIYGYGFSHQTDFLPLAVIRSIIACLGMFLGRNDFSAVNGTPLFSLPVSVFFFWLAHFCAMYATASAALTTIGAGALRRLRLWLAFWSDSTLIFGVNDDSVGFAKKLSDGRHPIIFADDRPDSSQAGAITAMGGVLCSDAADATPTPRFLRSVGVRPGKQSLTVYALHKDAGKNLRYATELLSALEQAGLSAAQTSLILLGAEEEDGRSLQATEESYGYGSVAVFDEATLAARLLVQEHPPCDHISFDEAGRAAEDFEALIIGFGQVGQAVLKHLVMHGQFEGSTFRLAVFAPNCHEVSGCITSCSQALTEHYDITFHAHDGRSREMYQYLSQHAKTLKYIAVCTGNDKLNREIADELNRYLRRLRCGAAVYRCGYTGVISQSGPGQPPRHKDIYTPDTLCTDRIDRMAMALNHSYCGENGRSAKENWLRCDYFNRLSSRASADFIPALLRAAGTTAEQAMAGEWQLTEEQLENLGRTEHLRWCAFHYVMGFATIDGETYAQRCAQYKREVAETGRSSIRVGKDMKRRLHACLIPWEQLDLLSAAENSVTGGSVDYKQLDKNNVLAVPDVLRAGNQMEL